MDTLRGSCLKYGYLAELLLAELELVADLGLLHAGPDAGRHAVKELIHLLQRPAGNEDNYYAAIVLLFRLHLGHW